MNQPPLKLERTTKACPKPLFYTLFGAEDVGLARGPVRGFSEWMFRQSDNWNVWKRRPAQFWKGYRRKEPDKESEELGIARTKVCLSSS
jgi:hypothetical protein